MFNRVSKALKTEISNIIGAEGSLRAKATKGAMWLYALEGMRRIMGVVQTIILARLLCPEDFGLVGIALIATGTLEVFSHTGFEKALVQRKEIDNNFLNTAWTVSIIRGLILCLVLFLVAPLITAFFDAPMSLPIIQVFAFNFLLNGLRNIGVIYFSKNLNFHKTFFWQLSTLLAGFSVTVSLAFVLRSVWAIVWGVMVSRIVETVGSFFISTYRPRLYLDFGIAKSLFGYGRWILGSNIVTFLAKQGDKLFLTKFFGVIYLGIYTMATRFVEQLTVVNSIAQRVLFPTYSGIQDDIERLRRIYLQVLSLISLLSVPVVGGMVFLAKPFILIFLGDKWIDSAVPMQILSLGILIKIFTDSSVSLFNAFGKPSVTFYMVIVRASTLFLTIIPLANKFGISGIALSFTISCLSGIVIWLIGLHRHFNIRFVENMKVMFVPVVVTMIIAIGAHYLSLYMPLDTLLQFITIVVISASIYIGIVITIYRLARTRLFLY